MQISILYKQSNLKYTLVRVVKPRSYYIERKTDGYKTELMSHNEAEMFILYGLTNKECEQLKYYKDNGANSQIL